MEETKAPRRGGGAELAGPGGCAEGVWSALRDVGAAYHFRSGDGQQAYLPATPLIRLGAADFGAAHGVDLPYVGGAMANGIASVQLVAALADVGALAFYGAAGQSPDVVEDAVRRLRTATRGRPFGVNLIHVPDDAAAEDALVDRLLSLDVRVVEAAAFLRLTLPVVRFRLSGIHRAADGRIVTPRRVMAKISRAEVASAFLSPAPSAMLAALVARGDLSEEQAALARCVPIAEDITAEADSGGHTDNRSALVLLPSMRDLAERMRAEHGYASLPRVGAAGGFGTPTAVAAAFAMGAAYVVTGTINQSCQESGTSALVRASLAEAGVADVAMAPAADMFEMGVKVQVLKRGTMFPMRAAKLYELYGKHASLDDLSIADRSLLEERFFREPLAEVWAGVERYFARRDPGRLARAQRDPRQKMALVFRSYLGRASRWANEGEASRTMDFQVWCGPAIGAFNAWTAGTPMAKPEGRRVGEVALNLLIGAAVQVRATMLRLQGVTVGESAAAWRPLTGAALTAATGPRARYGRVENDQGAFA